jgi:hypothetical protein
MNLFAELSRGRYIEKWHSRLIASRRRSGGPAKSQLLCYPLALVACFCLTLPVAAAHPDPPPQPYAAIPVEPLGYRPIGHLYMLLRLSSVSLNFIDDTHLLFTFHHFRLMSREAEQGHEDQIIRAMVLEIPSGKVDATAEWRMHDRRQYLFALGNGSFLIRQGSDIERTGRDLELHPFIRSQYRLEDVQISPDGKLLTVQSDLERHSAEKHKHLVEEAIANGDSLPDEDVDIQIVSLDDRQPVAEAKSDAPLRLAVSSAGYVDHEPSGANQWRLRLHPFDGKVKVLDDVHSNCAPSEEFVSTDTLLLSVCSTKSEDRYVTAITTDGREIWNGQWNSRYISPNFSYASAGNNFAISWLVASHPVDAYFSLSDEDVQGQAVQVLNTATGHLLLSVNASPVVSAGQNFALSADGTRLAVLNKGNIELYQVPPDKPK